MGAIRSFRLLAAGFVAIATSALGQPPVCTGEHCTVVAVEKAWPQPEANSGNELRLGRFRLRVPPGWDFISVLPDSGIAFNYGDKVVAVSLERVETYGVDAETLEDSGYGLVDIPRIIFTKTPRDVPKSENQAPVWEAAMRNKEYALEGAREAYAFEKGRTKAYLAPVDFSGFTSTAIVADERSPYSVISIIGRGINSSTLAAIIGTVTIKED